ncbi:MAG: M15 family metallopeptidase [Labilithrix sp.]|nr:M15 family metallopeptidase [Labilithrix sp.]MBX3222855.1 M15 family metallopeptidase [Labilithrix sp.]
MHAVRRTLAAAPLLLLLGASALPARGDDAKKEKPPEAKETKEAKAEAAPPKDPAPAAPGKLTVTLADGKTAHCREQSAQPFLIRGNWFPRTSDADKLKEGRKLLEEAIKYRTEKYGYFEGFGNPKSNPHPPKYYAKSTSFMGMSVQVHSKIIPALKCVEASLKAGPAGEAYKPRAMGGIRFHNTYRGVEISNHVYGIAIDIEPDKNTCCGCVAPWNNHPLCKQKDKTVWDRMVMPRSWVETFEKYGFYWLGHDVLQDTMHFEFLGDPDKITEPAADVVTK